MNAHRIALPALIVASAFVGTAFAESPLAGQQPASFQSSRSQADVQAELAQYKQAGVNPWSISYNPLRQFRSTTTRADVTAAYVASRDQVRAFSGEDSGSAYLARLQQATPSGTLVAERLR